jgi:hypothetical protein
MFNLKYIHGFPAFTGTYHQSPGLNPLKTVSKLQRILGMFNLFRRFHPHAATLQNPLHDDLSGPKVRVPIVSPGAMHSSQHS